MGMGRADLIVALGDKVDTTGQEQLKRANAQKIGGIKIDGFTKLMLKT